MRSTREQVNFSRSYSINTNKAQKAPKAPKNKYWDIINIKKCRHRVKHSSDKKKRKLYKEVWYQRPIYIKSTERHSVK